MQRNAATLDASDVPFVDGLDCNHETQAKLRLEIQ